MKFTTTATVVGMKSSKGTLENGTAYDSTKLYVQTDLDDSKGTAKGFCASEYGFGDSQEFQKFKHLPFPFVAEVEFSVVSNGKTQKTVVLSVKPTEMVKAKAAA